MNIYIDGQQTERVREFQYLGSLISDDGYCEKEIMSRIRMAKKVLQDKRKLFTGKMNLELKKRIVKCLVWSVATYAAETWMFEGRMSGKRTRGRRRMQTLHDLISDDGYCEKETYAAETWTLRETDRKKIEAFEMWIWR